MQELILYGSGSRKVRFNYRNAQGDLRVFQTAYEGVIPQSGTALSGEPGRTMPAMI